MIKVNYILEERILERITMNRLWMDSYIPSVIENLKEHNVKVYIDRQKNFDILHLHVPLFLAYKMVKKNSWPVVFHANATEETFTVGSRGRDEIRRWLLYFAKASDIIISPSNSARAYYQRHLPDKEAVVLNYGINLEKYSYDGHKGKIFRERFGLSEDDFMIACVGGLSKRKGIFEFIKVARRFPDFKFVWVGGLYLDKMINFATDLINKTGAVNLNRVPDNLTLAGYQKDVQAALSACDIFFFPSHQETQGFALVEAAANGRPIVTRDLPVFKEWLEDGKSCLMAGDLEGFMDKIERLAHDADLRNELGKKARERAIEHHDIRRTSAKLARIYQGLLET